uniref:Phospholipid-transporting ATPase n=1 Tax=Aureoumbra lagunensis TaxID=44058 RepID=A0A7S3JZM0_9STRA
MSSQKGDDEARLVEANDIKKNVSVKSEKKEWLWGKPKETVRRVEIGFDSPHVDNTATTSKYTILSFFPLALFGQFRRFANMYFLLVGLLMYFGETTGYFLSPYPAATTLAPLALVVAVSLLQEALTDLARHKADAEVNNRPTDLVNPSEQVPQFKVKTGKIIRVLNGDQIPADLVILATSTEANSCYIDTASIDGETSLKIRRAPQLEHPLTWMTEAAPKDEHQLHAIMEELEGVVECDPPNEHINSFTGTLKYAQCDELVPLSKDHVVLRGSSLHTDWLLGLAIYTGEDTKLALNARTPPQKLSRLDRVSNSVVLAIFGCQIALALITAGLQQTFEDKEFQNLWYVGFQNNKQIQRSGYIENTRWPDLEFSSSRQSFGWSFCTFLILYVNFIPLSLYVSLEMCFLVLVIFVNLDIKMYHAPTNTPALARSPTITDLGQVQYIFSDKTGTLTRNEMKLRRMIVHGIVYAVPEEDPEANRPDVQNGMQTPGGKEVLGDEGLPNINELATKACHEKDEYAACILEALMLCNTVVVENKNGVIKYQAESPDEGALVDGALHAGYKLFARTEHVLVGETPALNGARRSWHILATNEFDNDRKRMSIFLRESFDDEHAPQRDGRPMLASQPSIKSTQSDKEGGASLRGKVLLLCKGADNTMLAAAAPTNLDGLDDMRDRLDEFARQGLRTLVFGVRIFEEDEFESWHSEYYAPALASLSDRDGMLKKAAAVAEHMLTIVGATAIEDKLQIGVPETIATLAKAGIKLWVLTGDKRETAIEIGKSCRLLRPGMPLAILSSKASLSELKAALLKLYHLSGASPEKDVKDKKERAAVEQKLQELRQENNGSLNNFGDCAVWQKSDSEQVRALVIDGEAMTLLFGDRATEMILFSILSKCGSIIACRVTPKQKAQLVKLVQEHVKPTPVTLAIGDGANDVNMIMSAQVGVGISGHEGLQAVNASDFAIAQFRYLLRLLLIHGRWGYRRVCILINFSFYKNACLAATLFIYTNFTGYSGTSLFSDYFTALFNFFLFLMIFYTAIFDQDVDDEYVHKYPQLYASGRCNLDLNVTLALNWIFMALLHAAIIFFLPAGALSLGTGDRTDLVSYEAFGAVVSCGFINYMNLKVLFETRYFTYPLAASGKQCERKNIGILGSTWFAAVFNTVFFYLGLYVAGAVGDGTSFIFQMLPFWNVGATILGHSTTWAITFLVIAACAAVDFIKYAIVIYFFPSPISVSIERCRLGLDNTDENGKKTKEATTQEDLEALKKNHHVENNA